MLKIDTNALKILLIASTLLFQSCSKKENKYVSTRRTPTDNAVVSEPSLANRETDVLAAKVAPDACHKDEMPS